MGRELEDIHPGDDEEGCGYSYDHTIVELGDGHWMCSECEAEGWDEEEEDQ